MQHKSYFTKKTQNKIQLTQASFTKVNDNTKNH